MKSLMKWALYLTGLMPVIYSTNSLFPFIFPKGLYFRGLVFVAVVAFCIACAQDKKFLGEMIAKIKSLWQHSVFKWMTLFYGSLVLSTIFAFDRYMAMFGNIEREEGFVGLFFFYVFFVLVAMVFEKRDWLKFFATSLLAAGILFVVEVSQSYGGNGRPGSLTDNPIFLSTYYVFTIFAAAVLWRIGKAKENILVMSLSVFSIILSFIGIVLAETRGTLLGMLAGGVVVLVYLGFRGKNITISKNITSRKLVIGLLLALGIFSSVFIVTRKATIWTEIPGIRRIAMISTTDGTTQARFVNGSIALHSMNPTESSVTRTLFGWGWDNYVYAWQKFYNPKLYDYDGALFDRAHDKVMDVLVMSGVVGLIFYLGMWFFFFKEAFKKEKGFSGLMALFVFWGVTYFLQNLTVFDTMVTFITFYAMFAYLTYETRQNTNEITK